MEIGIVNF